MPIGTRARYLLFSIELTSLLICKGFLVSIFWNIYMLISLVVSFFTGGSIELMWSMTNTLQIMFFYGWMNLYFTPEVLVMFTVMKFSNFDNPLFEYIRNKVFLLFSILSFPEPPSYQKFGLIFSNILINFWDKIILMLLFLLSVILVALLSYRLRKKENRFANYIRNKDLDFRYEGISRFFIEMILKLSFVSLVNVIFGDQNNIFDIVSYIIACLFLLLILSMIFYI